MGKIKVVNNISLDGVMQSPAAKDEDTRGGFTQGGWAVPYQDDVIAKKMGEMMANGEKQGSLLFGRRTYEHLFSVWGNKTDNPFSEHFNKVRKYVASRRLQESLSWQNSVLLQGDAAVAVEKMKREGDAHLTILGSGELIKSLMKRNLIDEFVLLEFPIVLGAGRRLFPEGNSVRLRLMDSLQTPSGVIIAVYQAA